MIVVQGQPGQKVFKTPSHPMAGHGGMYLPFSYMGKHKYVAYIPGQPGRKGRSYLKTSNKKGLAEWLKW
jgi:hypothetical protein